MNRYINADALLKHFDSAEQVGFGIIETQLAKELIQDEPTADVVEVVHSEWKRISHAKIYECSVCGQTVMTDDIDCYSFCHNCGAKMDGDSNDE